MQGIWKGVKVTEDERNNDCLWRWVGRNRWVGREQVILEGLALQALLWGESGRILLERSEGGVRNDFTWNTKEIQVNWLQNKPTISYKWINFLDFFVCFFVLFLTRQLFSRKPMSFLSACLDRRSGWAILTVRGGQSTTHELTSSRQSQGSLWPLCPKWSQEGGQPHWPVWVRPGPWPWTVRAVAKDTIYIYFYMYIWKICMYL